MGATLRQKWKVFVKYVKQLTLAEFIAAMSVIIAVASLILAYNQTEESRKQTQIMIKQVEEMSSQSKEMRNYSQKSTMPVIGFLCEKSWPILDEFGLYIANNGTGPAIIKAVILEVNGKAYDGCNLKGFEEALTAMGLQNTEEYLFRYKIFQKNTQLYQGQRDIFIVMHFGGERDEAMFNKFEKGMSQLMIIIIYESTYGKLYIKTYKYSEQCK